MHKRILIANRGEIAVRIMRACEELGLTAIGVYSEVDRMAPHVRRAHEAYCLGPARLSQSYLNRERILEVAREAKADAVHPGYGFLAEDADFAQAVADAGLAWIGPPAAVIRAMGDKISARRHMRAAGVPIVPGTEENLDDQALLAAAAGIGFPLLVKASAGGGGKGMRTVHRTEDLPAAISAARSEARASFGDDRVYLEKLITGARHIEIQVLADQHGHVIHLGERECSIQRRHQKLIEEAPSVAVSRSMRARMGDLAVQAARQVGYVSAGTIEFLLDRDGSFYFLEMNTRLQVEHPITELITGVDIVTEMIRIAGGRELRYSQADIQPNGWAIECRVLAEDAHNNFLPSTGTITSLREPTGPGVRVESGVYQGMEISPYYDSMIAKLSVRGETRGEAILRMRRALREYQITGVKTTLPFHRQIMDSPRYQAGQLDTRFLEDHFTLHDDVPPQGSEVAALAAALLAHQNSRRAARLTRNGASPWKVAGRVRRLRDLM